MKLQNIALAISAVTTGLLAGLFLTFSLSVSPGLSHLPDSEYIFAMQAITKAIRNPVVFVMFFGTALFLPLCAYILYLQPSTKRFKFLVAASILYLIGVFFITVKGNIPLNVMLNSFNTPNALHDEIVSQRNLYESSWNGFNIVRTIASLSTFICVILACLSNEKNE